MHYVKGMLRRLALTGSLSLCSLAASAQVAVIVNPKSGVTNLTADQIASLYLGKTTSLPGGVTQPIDLGESNPVREQFYGKAAGKNPSQVKAIWARLMFSGKASPPKELASAAEVKKLVASNPEAIGYVEKSAVDSSVKIALTLD
jgi:ABC-type phosphate transport system substrate-binding protein